MVLSLSVADIVEGRVQVPFKNRKAWLDVQQECPDLRKVFTFMRSGTEPTKKQKNLRAVRRYLHANLIIAHDGLLVLRKADPLSPMTDHVVIPQQVLHGLLSALHLKLNHPTAFQLTKVFNREFYALNVAEAILSVSKNCHLCESIKDVPKALIKQSCNELPSAVGVSLAADVFKRSKQNILILRETTTSYTVAELIPNETSKEIAEALLRMCCILRPNAVKEVLIRVDPSPAHRSLFLNSTSILKEKNIQLELGRELNTNKNPVAEKCIREITRELLVITPESHEISTTTLALAVANLNSRIRDPGLSSYELWTQRDQVSGEQLPIDDDALIENQHNNRLNNHRSSEKSKASGKPQHPTPSISTGSLVYLYDDRDKESPRPRYLVTSINDGWCKLRRFAQKYFGGRTYDAQLEQCYAVPTRNDPDLSLTLSSDTDSDSDWEESEETHHISIHAPVNKDNAEPVVAVPEHDQTVQIQEEPIPMPPPKELVQPPQQEDPILLPPPKEVQPPKPRRGPGRPRKKTKELVMPHQGSSRPKRKVKMPEKFKEFVMDVSD